MCVCRIISTHIYTFSIHIDLGFRFEGDSDPWSFRFKTRFEEVTAGNRRVQSSGVQ